MRTSPKTSGKMRAGGTPANRSSGPERLAGCLQGAALGAHTDTPTRAHVIACSPCPGSEPAARLQSML